MINRTRRIAATFAASWLVITGVGTALALHSEAAVLCMDGWVSSQPANVQGTCSWHDGIKDPNYVLPPAAPTLDETPVEVYAYMSPAPAGMRCYQVRGPFGTPTKDTSNYPSLLIKADPCELSKTFKTKVKAAKAVKSVIKDAEARVAATGASLCGPTGAKAERDSWMHYLTVKVTVQPCMVRNGTVLMPAWMLQYLDTFH